MRTVREGDELRRERDGKNYKIIRIVNRVILMKASDPDNQSLLVAAIDSLDEFVSRQPVRDLPQHTRKRPRVAGPQRRKSSDPQPRLPLS
jgi:hypothetical protein